MRKLNRQKRKEKSLPLNKVKGFTLIEVLLATTIYLIGLSAGVMVLALGYKHFTLGRNVGQEQMARIALEKMVRELQETGISTIEPDSSIIYSEENSSNIISFASARDEDDVDGDGDTGFSIDEQTGMPYWINAIVYFRGEQLIDEYPDLVDPDKLYRYKESLDTYDGDVEIPPSEEKYATLEPMADSINDLKFWFSDDELLNIKIKIALAEEENPYQLILTTTIKIRN